MSTLADAKISRLAVQKSDGVFLVHVSTLYMPFGVKTVKALSRLRMEIRKSSVKYLFSLIIRVR